MFHMTTTPPSTPIPLSTTQQHFQQQQQTPTNHHSNFQNNYEFSPFSNFHLECTPIPHHNNNQNNNNNQFGTPLLSTPNSFPLIDNINTTTTTPFSMNHFNNNNVSNMNSINNINNNSQQQQQQLNTPFTISPFTTTTTTPQYFSNNNKTIITIHLLLLLLFFVHLQLKVQVLFYTKTTTTTSRLNESPFLDTSATSFKSTTSNFCKNNNNTPNPFMSPNFQFVTPVNSNNNNNNNNTPNSSANNSTYSNKQQKTPENNNVITPPNQIGLAYYNQPVAKTQFTKSIIIGNHNFNNNFNNSGTQSPTRLKNTTTMQDSDDEDDENKLPPSAPKKKKPTKNLSNNAKVAIGGFCKNLFEEEVLSTPNVMSLKTPTNLDGMSPSSFLFKENNFNTSFNSNASFQYGSNNSGIGTPFLERLVNSNNRSIIVETPEIHSNKKMNNNSGLIQQQQGMIMGVHLNNNNNHCFGSVNNLNMMGVINDNDLMPPPTTPFSALTSAVGNGPCNVFDDFVLGEEEEEVEEQDKQFSNNNNIVNNFNNFNNNFNEQKSIASFLLNEEECRRQQCVEMTHTTVPNGGVVPLFESPDKSNQKKRKALRSPSYHRFKSNEEMEEDLDLISGKFNGQDMRKQNTNGYLINPKAKLRTRK
ncbi:hypothetical protein ABK040_001036 [Willaertia magna]